MADVVPRAVAAPRVLTDNASDTVRGIALALLAYLIWTMGDATAKLTLPTAGVAGAGLLPPSIVFLADLVADSYSGQGVAVTFLYRPCQPRTGRRCREAAT